MSRSFSAIACLIALATALPAPAPGRRASFPLLKRQSGDPYNEDWESISCQTGSLTDIYNDPWLQWNDSAAGAAWDDMKQSFLDSGETGLPEFIGNFFNARPDLSCELLDNPNCEVTINCGEGSGTGQPTNAPAGYVIVNSLVGLHTVFDNAWNAINGGLATASPKIGTFVEELSPIGEDIEDQQRQKLILDAMQGALFALVAPSFHIGLRRTDWYGRHEKGASVGLDVTYGGIGTVMAAVKDAMDTISPLPVQNMLSTYVSDTASSWLGALNNSMPAIFNNPDSLFSFVDQGRVFGLPQDESPYDALLTVEKALYAASLAAIWASGSDSPGAFILNTAGLPQDGTGCESWRPQDNEIYALERSPLSEDALASGFVCAGDDAFWLLGATLERSNCSPLATGGECPNDLIIDSLQGIDTLVPDGKWAGLTKDEVVLNAVNSWNANGQQNNWDPLSAFTGPDDVDALVSGDLATTRGVVNIPICSLQEAVDTAFGEGDRATNPNWPCPSPVENLMDATLDTVSGLVPGVPTDV